MVKKQSLAETHPELCEEWDYRKNQLLGLSGPVKITHGSGKKVWWKPQDFFGWRNESHKQEIFWFTLS